MKNFFQDFKDNLINQYSECPAYKLLCDSEGFNPSVDLNSEKDMELVPYVATTLFKKSADMFTKLLRVPLDSIDIWTTSSSTSGDPSVVGRQMCDIMQIREFINLDEKTISPFSDYDCVFYPEPEVMKRYKSEVINGKSTESYIGNILDIYNFKENTVFLIEENGEDLTIDINAFKKFLLTHDKLEHHLSIRGSTILLFNAVKVLKEKMPSVRLGRNVLVHTGGGGWDGKKGTLSAGAALRRQVFVETVAEFLGIPEENFIDTYSFTENCFPITGHYSKKYKDYLFHVPPVGKVIIRDIKTLKPLHNVGDRGFIQMLNAYGTSSFAGASILVDDIGEIVSLNQCPECGEPCMTLKIIGRVKGAEAKGCGATLNVRSDE